MNAKVCFTLLAAVLAAAINTCDASLQEFFDTACTSVRTLPLSVNAAGRVVAGSQTYWQIICNAGSPNVTVNEYNSAGNVAYTSNNFPLNTCYTDGKLSTTIKVTGACVSGVYVDDSVANNDANIDFYDTLECSTLQIPYSPATISESGCLDTSFVSSATTSLQVVCSNSTGTGAFVSFYSTANCSGTATAQEYFVLNTCVAPASSIGFSSGFIVNGVCVNDSLVGPPQPSPSQSPVPSATPSPSVNSKKGDANMIAIAPAVQIAAAAAGLLFMAL